MSENPGNRKTITIKINGQERPFHDKEKGNKVMGADSSSQIEEKKERNNQVFQEEAAAGSEVIGEESFDWILPTDEQMEEVNEFQITEQTSKEKLNFFNREKTITKNKTLPNVVPSIFFAVLFAVILGTGFGFVLLKMVSTDQQAAAPTTTGTAAVAPTKTTEKPGKTTSTAVAEKKEISTYIVQHIILSKETAVKQEQTKLLKKGYISQRIDGDGKIGIYLGVASDIESAKKMQKEIKKNDVEAFAKEITFGSGKIKNISQNEKSFIEHAPEMYAILTNAVTAAQYNQGISDEMKTNLNKQKAVIDKLNTKDFKNEKIKTMAAELTNGLTTGIALSQNSGQKEIQTIQKGLLTFLGEYSAL
ncbi:MAG: SPOR domain-containing protein [Bacillus sp. (in: firmicutes)]